MVAPLKRHLRLTNSLAASHAITSLSRGKGAAESSPTTSPEPQTIPPVQENSTKRTSPHVFGILYRQIGITMRGIQTTSEIICNLATVRYEVSELLDAFSLDGSFTIRHHVSRGILLYECTLQLPCTETDNETECQVMQEFWALLISIPFVTLAFVDDAQFNKLL